MAKSGSWCITKRPEFIVVGIPMRLNSCRLLLLLVFWAGVFAAPLQAGPLEDLKPGHWYEAPNSAMSQVVPKPVPAGNSGPLSVIRAVSGGAYDSKRDLFIVWGGGDTAYGGNEVYAFDVKSLKWTRLTDPSKDVGGIPSSGYYPDGKPRSRHTYDMLEYIPPPVDLFCSLGAANLYPTRATLLGNTDCLDIDTGKWKRMRNSLSYGNGGLTAYDPVTKRVYVHGVMNSGFLVSFDAMKNQWHVHGRKGIEDGFVAEKLNAAIDPRRRLFVAVGVGKVHVWKMNASGFVKATAIKTTGDKGIQDAKSPGFAYDPVIKKFVAWSGGSEVYILDVVKKHWTKRTAAKTNKINPGLPAIRGTFSRFRYIPSKNVYVVVNDIDANVFFYRLTNKPKSRKKK